MYRGRRSCGPSSGCSEHEKFDARRLRPMFGKLALSSLANMRSGEPSRQCGQRLGAARKAGSFEGTLPRPFSFAQARTENWKTASFKPAFPSPNLPDLTQLPSKRVTKKSGKFRVRKRVAPFSGKGQGRRATGIQFCAGRASATRQATQTSRVDRAVRAWSLLLDSDSIKSQTRRVGGHRQVGRCRTSRFDPAAARTSQRRPAGDCDRLPSRELSNR